MLDKYPQKVKVVIKNFPLSGHRYAQLAAAAALAAHKQGKFWEMHQKLFENQRILNAAKIEEIAKELGLDMEIFNRDLRDQNLHKLVIRDLKEGQAAGVQGSPTIFINGKVVRKRDLQTLSEMIDAALKKAETTH